MVHFPVGYSDIFNSRISKYSLMLMLRGSADLAWVQPNEVEYILHQHGVTRSTPPFRHFPSSATIVPAHSLLCFAKLYGLCSFFCNLEYGLLSSIIYGKNINFTQNNAHFLVIFLPYDYCRIWQEASKAVLLRLKIKSKLLKALIWIQNNFHRIRLHSGTPSNFPDTTFT